MDTTGRIRAWKSDKNGAICKKIGRNFEFSKRTVYFPHKPLNNSQTTDMANSFKFEKTNTKSVKNAASKEYRKLEMKISQLTIARQWTLVAIAVYSVFQLAMLALDWQRVLSDVSGPFYFVALLGTFGFIDQQIKYLKTLQDSMVVKRINP